MERRGELLCGAGRGADKSSVGKGKSWVGRNEQVHASNSRKRAEEGSWLKG